MIKTRTSVLNSLLPNLLLGFLLLPVLASCGGGGGSVTPPPVVPPAVVVAPVDPVVVPVTLPALVISVDRPSLQLVEKANVPPQAFILTINRTPDQVNGIRLGNVTRLGATAPVVDHFGVGTPEVKNGTTSWYMNVDAQTAVQGDYTFTLSVLDLPGNVVGSTTIQVKVVHDVRLETDAGTWAPYEQQVLALVNEVRTKGTLNGSAAAVAGTCAAGVAPLKALLPSSVGYLAARGHVNWFANYGYTAHVEMDHSNANFYGELLSDRLDRARGIVGTNVDTFGGGENAAAGQTSPLEVMTAWIHSAGHCANIMNPNITHMGAGYASAPQYREFSDRNIYKDSWVQVFLKY